jgi:uncharacterized membrane protein YkvA (DUF1232 family)
MSSTCGTQGGTVGSKTGALGNMTWIWIILALVYVLSRIDLIPDVLGIWGWLDDILVLYLLYR